MTRHFRTRPSWAAGWPVLFAMAMVIVSFALSARGEAAEGVHLRRVLGKIPPALLEREELPDSVRVVIAAMSAFSALFFFCVGLSVGSFLNVVIYRFPRGLSLIHPPSACPACGTRIESRDNLPLLGWLRLRGKCRTCQGAISARYPLVELAVGLIALALLYIELLSGGTNLPRRSPYGYAGFVWILWYTKWDLIGIYLFHCTLLVTLLALALMDVDGQPARWHPLRRSLALLVALPALLALVAVPGLQPVPFLDPMPEWISKLSWMFPWRDPWSGWEWKVGASAQGGIGGLLGWGTGVLAGTALAAVFRRSRPDGLQTVSVMLGLVGLFLGWQAALICLPAVAALLRVKTLTPAGRALTPAFVTFLACLSLIVFWRSIDRLVGMAAQTLAN